MRPGLESTSNILHTPLSGEFDSLRLESLLQSVPLARCGHSNVRWSAHGARCPSGPSSTSPNMLSRPPQAVMWRRTTGELLEVRRSALRSGASLPGNWRFICDRADLGPRGEQLSWARPHSDPLTPTNGTTAGRAFAYISSTSDGGATYDQ